MAAESESLRAAQTGEDCSEPWTDRRHLDDHALEDADDDRAGASGGVEEAGEDLGRQREDDPGRTAGPLSAQRPGRGRESRLQRGTVTSDTCIDGQRARYRLRLVSRVPVLDDSA